MLHFGTVQAKRQPSCPEGWVKAQQQQQHQQQQVEAGACCSSGLVPEPKLRHKRKRSLSRLEGSLSRRRKHKVRKAALTEHSMGLSVRTASGCLTAHARLLLQWAVAPTLQQTRGPPSTTRRPTSTNTCVVLQLFSAIVVQRKRVLEGLEGSAGRRRRRKRSRKVGALVSACLPACRIGLGCGTAGQQV